MTAKSQVLSLRVPEGSGLQARFTMAAKKACILPWELLSRMLDEWESGQKELSSDSLLSEIKSLRADLDETKNRLAQLENNVDNADNSIGWDDINAAVASAVNNVDKHGNIIIRDVQPNADTTRKKRGRPKKEKPVENDSITESDVSNFDAAYAELSKDRYDVLIPDLRQKLRIDNYSDKKIDALFRHVQDKGQYQLQAAELENLTQKQLKDGFVDENGFKFWGIFKIPAKRKAGRPRKTAAV